MLEHINRKGYVEEMNESQHPLSKPTGHHCFACGTDNPSGLHLDFYVSGDRVCTDVILDRYRVGWEGIAHGGIISTLLDEIMSWTILYFRRVFFVTRKMEVRYVKPVPIEEPLTVRGRLGKDRLTPKIEVHAEIVDRHGNQLARSTGEFVELTGDRLAMIPAELRDEMNSLFEGFARS
jgi:acyl-coenzyme A thioesterase PaaI-like protein